MKMERLIGILSILLQREKVTAAELSEQLRETGAIRSRKVFGEYGLYCDDVFCSSPTSMTISFL